MTVTARPDEDGALVVATGDLKLVGDVALAHGLPLWGAAQHRR